MRWNEHGHKSTIISGNNQSLFVVLYCWGGDNLKFSEHSASMIILYALAGEAPIDSTGDDKRLNSNQSRKYCNISPFMDSHLDACTAHKMSSSFPQTCFKGPFLWVFRNGWCHRYGRSMTTSGHYVSSWAPWTRWTMSSDGVHDIRRRACCADSCSGQFYENRTTETISARKWKLNIRRETICL